MKSSSAEIMEPKSENWRIPQLFSDLSPGAQEQLKAFFDELMKFNRAINLISATTVAHSDLVHFADSIHAARAVMKAVGKDELYDLGSGNGFPGLVCAILAPEASIVLVDRDTRKVEFLKHVAKTLKLANVKTSTARLEDLPAGSVKFGVSRGFASVSKAIMMGRSAFAPGGRYFHLKGDAWGRELAEIPSQLCSIWEPSLFCQYEIVELKQKFSVVETKRR